MANLSLLFMSQLSIANLDRLPSKSGIYYAIDSWGEVRYVGMATDLHQRWNGHGRYRHHKRDALEAIGGVTLKYRMVPEYRLRYEEAIAIAKFSPDLNVQIPNPENHYSLRIKLDCFLGNVGSVAYVAIATLVIGQAMGVPTLSNLTTAARHHIEAAAILR